MIDVKVVEKQGLKYIGSFEDQRKYDVRDYKCQGI